MIISVSDTPEGFRLMVADGQMRSMPAGPRIFRAPPIPDVLFVHSTREAAETDAGKIRVYLSALEPRRQSKKELQKFVE
jgi:hypothetical protein